MITPPKKEMINAMIKRSRKMKKIAGVKEGSKFTIDGKEYKRDENRSPRGEMK